MRRIRARPRPLAGSGAGTGSGGVTGMSGQGGLRARLRRLVRLFDLPRLHRRIERLEALLLEHPQAHAGARPAEAFPSPAVSVLMPTWNRARIVGDAIRSVQAQSFTDWELIVVDDGSTDDTAATMAQFAGDPRIRYVPRPHAGHVATRNHALSLARGALVAYCDSDNIWYPGFLAAAVAAFAADPGLDSLYGAMVTDAHHEGEWLIFEPWDRERLERGNFIDISTFMHRRALYERLGGFDPAILRVDDWDLILRYTKGSPPLRLPVLAVRYRVMDDIRMTDAAPLAPDLAIVRRKLRGQG